MSINVYKPIDAVSSINIDLQEGGDLEPDTTYYVSVIGWSADHREVIVSTDTRRGLFSDLGVEESFTTTSTHKKVHVTWSNVINNTPESRGNVWYLLLVSKTSSDYTGKGSLPISTTNLAGAITNGATGYVLENENQIGGGMVHFAQLVNEMPVNKHLGCVRVDISGGDYDWDDVVQAIKDAGFSDYYSYDNFNFYGNISIFCYGVGTLTIQRKNIVLARGLMYSSSDDYKIIFGEWTDDEVGYSVGLQSNIEFMNSRYPIRSLSSNNIEFYGGSCLVSDRAYFTLFPLSEPIIKTSFLIGHAQLSGFMGGFKEVSIGQLRGIGGNLYDLKVAVRNNWSGGTHYRLRVISETSAHNWLSGAYYDENNLTRGWVDTIFTGTRPCGCRRMGTAANINDVYAINLWNPKLVRYFDNKLPEDALLFSNNLDIGDGKTANNNRLQVWHSFRLKVFDESGDPIVGARITIRDKNNDIVNLYELVDDDNTSGETPIPANLITDSAGETDRYYLRSYYIEKSRESGGASSYDGVITDFNPFKITVEGPDGDVFIHASDKDFWESFTENANINFSSEIDESVFFDFDASIKMATLGTGNSGTVSYTKTYNFDSIDEFRTWIKYDRLRFNFGEARIFIGSTEVWNSVVAEDNTDRWEDWFEVTHDTSGISGEQEVRFELSSSGTGIADRIVWFDGVGLDFYDGYFEYKSNIFETVVSEVDVYDRQTYYVTLKKAVPIMLSPQGPFLKLNPENIGVGRELGVKL